MSALLRRALAGAAIWALGGLAFECTTDVQLGPAVSSPRKGIALDDSTLRWCPSQIPQAWPNAAEQRMTSIRIFKAWDRSWEASSRQRSWQDLVDYAVQTNAKVFIGTEITCDEKSDDRSWKWTKKLVEMLHPEHVMGLAIGNEIELLQFKGEDMVNQSCLTELWENGYVWRKFQEYVKDFDKMGFGSVPITSVFTGLGLAGEPFYELPGKARVSSFLTNVTKKYGHRFAFTWNFYPYFDPNMRLDAGTEDECDGALHAAGCWGPNCVVPSQLRHARVKMEALTGRSDSLLWVGETGWSSPLSGSLETEMKNCPAWSSAETFERFYRGFLDWDLDIGGGMRPPDHVFWFTMRDAINFGVGEHFGLISRCDEPKCKIKSADFEPFIFEQHVPAGRYACGGQTLFNGFVWGGKETCQNKCEMNPRCGFYGIWPHSHDNMFWCRHTEVCNLIIPDDYIVSTYRKAPGASATTRVTTSRPQPSTTTRTTTTEPPSTTTTEPPSTTTTPSPTTTTTAVPTETSTSTLRPTQTETTTVPTTTPPSTTTVTTAAPTTTLAPTETETTTVAPTETETTTLVPTTTTPAPTTTEPKVTPAPTETTTPVPTEPETTTAAPTEAETTVPAPTEAETTTTAPTETDPTTAAPTETDTTTAAPAETTEPAESSTSALPGDASTTSAEPAETTTMEAPVTTTGMGAPETTIGVGDPTVSTKMPSPVTSSGPPAVTGTTSSIPTGSCDFAAEPVTGYFWDASCKAGMLGCNADGKSMSCRWCGDGDYAEIPCPPSSCHFPNEPATPYYWDMSCEMGKLGCWADGVHEHCRFCGKAPFTSIPCPFNANHPITTACNFDHEPATSYFYDPTCEPGMVGCFADAKTLGCRFCGEGAYSEIECPPEKTKMNCTFAHHPAVPYYWDEDCHNGMLGCLADGVHRQCRFCAVRPFESIECPETISLPMEDCSFPNEPVTPYYWDDSCKLGILGCWADGLHAQCRFCGEGVYASIACPAIKHRSAVDHDAMGGFLVSKPAGSSLARDIDVARKGASPTAQPDEVLSSGRRPASGGTAVLLGLAAVVAAVAAA